MKLADKLNNLVLYTIVISILCYVFNVYIIFNYFIIISTEARHYSTVFRCLVIMAVLVFMVVYWFNAQVKYNKKLNKKSISSLLIHVVCIVLLQSAMLDLLLWVLKILNGNKLNINANVGNNFFVSTTLIVFAMLSSFLTILIYAKTLNIGLVVPGKKINRL